MAYTFTADLAHADSKSWTLKCLDADVTGQVAHGFGAAPKRYFVVPETTAIAAAGLPGITADATNLTVTKANTAGSGGTTPGTTVAYRVYAERPHSLP